jgi:hypothetical protein
MIRLASTFGAIEAFALQAALPDVKNTAWRRIFPALPTQGECDGTLPF